MDSCEYQVTIKSANQKVDDYVTKCLANWTVHRLKQHISETHINKPTVEDQRLIYAGNLLKDTQILKQIFFRDSLCTELTNSSKTDFTIHLVCNTRLQRTTGSPTNAAANRPTTTTTTTTATTTNNTQTTARASPLTAQPSSPSNTRPNVEVNNNSTSTAERARFNQGPFATRDNLNPPTNGQSIIMDSAQQAEMIQSLMQSDQMRQQMAVFQQLACIVAAQIANTLTNRENPPANHNIQTSQPQAFTPVLNGQTLNIRITTSSNPLASAAQLLYANNRQQVVSVNTQNTAHRVNQNENLNNENNDANAPVVGEAANDQFNFGAPMQADPVVDQPGPQPEQQIPIMQHDMIDWVYYSLRAAILMAALYIHASMFRLLFMVGLLAVAYFFNRRSARRANRNRNEPRAEANIAEGQREVRQDGENEQQDVVDPGEDVANDGEDANVNIQGENQQAREVAPARLPFLKLCYLVITDFLASLVPE